MSKTPEPGSLCEGCRNPNAWMLIDPIYSHVCGGCAEKGSSDVMFMTQHYRGFRKCSCGCLTLVSMANAAGELFCRSCKKKLFLGGCPPESI